MPSVNMYVYWGCGGREEGVLGMWPLNHVGGSPKRFGNHWSTINIQDL